MTKEKRKLTFRRWLQSTPRRTFILYPILIILLELLIHNGQLNLNILGALLLPWGYLQYRLCGNYRTKHGGGGPGVDVPPEQVVDTGLYAWTRNPMYMGHLIFMIGLIIVFNSIPALLILLYHIYWFNNRAKNDEKHLTELFGDEYLLYKMKVKRWIPGVY
jgi:protein-S-isoprenylcysteine O-methyltransferase Ste14